jgi:hypothetical protein
MIAPLCRRLVVLLPAIALVSVAPARGQVVSRVAPDRVTVRAERVPIGKLLTELLAIERIDAVDIDPGVSTVPVTFTAENVTPFAAIVTALKSGSLDFLMSKTQLKVGYTRKVTEAPRETPTVVYRPPDLAERVAVERQPASPPDDRTSSQTP